MKINNEPGVKQNQSLLRIIVVSTLIVGVLAIVFFLAGNFFPSTKTKAAAPSVINISGSLNGSSNISLLSQAVDGDTIKVVGLLTISSTNTSLQNKNVILLVVGGNMQWAGKYKIYLGSGSKVLLKNGMQLIASAPSFGADASIYFNGVKVVSYNGSDADYSFSDVNTSGGVQSAGLTTLPVKLVRFETFLEKGLVNIKWATASEVNNDKFEIERSDNSKIWKLIGQVKGNGNSNKLIQYSYIDNPGVISGALYYRLRQVDYDGANEYGPISVVRNDNREKSAKVYPNPANDVLNISLNKGSYNLSLMDATGKEIFSKHVDSDFEMLDTKVFANGNYVLKLEGENVSETHRVIIRH